VLALFNKPFNVLSPFTGDAHQRTQASYFDIPNVHAAGRLNEDSP
jgi:23S rRNA pseudouridine2457 synthase